MRRQQISVTTDTAGDGTTTGQAIFGKVFAVLWNRGTCDTGVDITVSTVNNDVVNSLLVVANADASKYFYPRTLQHLDTDGSNLATHVGPVAAGQLRLVIAQGGNTKKGTVTVYYDED